VSLKLLTKTSAGIDQPKYQCNMSYDAIRLILLEHRSLDQRFVRQDNDLKELLSMVYPDVLKSRDPNNTTVPSSSST